jgi:hypothetical protein
MDVVVKSCGQPTGEEGSTREESKFTHFWYQYLWNEILKE